MKTKSVVPTLAVLLGGASLFLASPAFAEETPTERVVAAAANEGVCDDLNSGKKDVNGTVTEIVLTAPEGNVITEYCVKAGSINNENGPEYVTVNPPTQTVTITYPGGKDISHYSFAYEPTPTPTPTPTPEPTPTPTEPPAGGGDGGAELAETGFDAGWLPFVGIGALALGAALVVPRLVAKRR